MKRIKVLRWVIGFGFVVILVLMTVSIVEGKYLEAIAIFSIASVLAWFALGAGRREE